MTNKLTIEQITDALASAGCSISRLHSIPSYLQIMGRTESITSAITLLVEAATFDANVECGKAIERQKHWRSRSVEANTELSEAWGDYAAMKSERDELRKQLAASQNDVKQLRAARDKRKPECVQTTAKASTQERGCFRAGLGIGAIIDREFEKVRAACRKNDESINDGWIECKYLPINQWCDVKRADGTTDRVRTPEVRGVQQAAEITHYRPVKKEAKPKQDDGWIAWESIVWGDCPVEHGTPVIVRYRDGAVSGVLEAMKLLKGTQRDASVAFWYQQGYDVDIVAYKLAPKAADNGDWIEWGGSQFNCYPKGVDCGVWVDVRLRDGSSSKIVAQSFNWQHKNHPGDIIAYRLVK